MSRKKGPKKQTALEHVRIFSDAPHTDDTLEFGAYAQTLAGLALQRKNATPFTAVIRGDWGRGKTSLMRMVQKRLDASEKSEYGPRQVQTLWFDAWKYSSEDTVLAGLLGALIRRLSENNSLKTQFAEFVNRNKYTVAGRILKAAAPFLDLHLGPAEYGQIGKKRAYYDEFRRLFAQLWLVWQQPMYAASFDRDTDSALRDGAKDQVLAIFLDDLDRCSDATVSQIIETLYLLNDIPGVCFYLGVDWQRLRRIVRKQLVESRGSAPDDKKEIEVLVRDYLEKIYQVRIDLPRATALEMQGWLEQLTQDMPLGDVLGEYPEMLSELIGLLGHENRARPRYGKLLLNDVQVLAGLLDAHLERMPEAVPTADGAFSDEKLDGRRQTPPTPVAPDLNWARSNLTELALSWRLLQLAVEQHPALHDRLLQPGNLATLLREYGEVKGEAAGAGALGEEGEPDV